MLAYITGSVNESLLHRIEHLLEENHVLRNQIQKGIQLTAGEAVVRSQAPFIAVRIGHTHCFLRRCSS